MDALPVLVLVGYLIGNLRIVSLTGIRERGQLIMVVAQVVLSMQLGYVLAPTAVTMAGAGFGALVGISFPLLSTSRPGSDHRSLAASGAAVAMLMPQAAAVGFILFAAGYLATRRLTLSAMLAMLVVPWGAWWIQGSDLFLLFGGVVWLMLVYLNLDRVEIQIRHLMKLPTERLIFRRHLRRGLMVLALAACFVLFFLNRYVYHGFGLHPQVFRQGSPTLNYIALTFDDGPHPEYTNQILDILADRGIPATFFVVGRHVDRYPEVTQRMLDEGHEVGSHTYNHLNLLNADEATVTRELEMTERALREACDFEPRFFRPPRGLYNQVTLDTAHERGYTLVLWSLSSTDWMGTAPSRIARLITGRVHGGDILLFHDSGDFFTAAGASRANTVAALGPMIDSLTEQGYRFVTITEMMVMSLLLEGEPP